MGIRNRCALGRARGSVVTSGVLAVALSMTACGGSDSDSSKGEKGEKKLTVVASTAVWGSVAQAVGGHSVEVESIIANEGADPHSYETTPRDAAKVNDADLVVYNGGGYDEFIEEILGTTEGKPTVQAFQGESAEHSHGEEQGHSGEHSHGDEQGHGDQHSHGHEHSHGGNEHVWYDLHVVHETADRIAGQLRALRPGQAGFREAANRFGSEVERLEGRVTRIAERHGGKPVIMTEPVAHYLVEQAKLNDVTPQSFVNAIEAENDPSAASVAEIKDAVRSGAPAAVLYNPQTASPVTENVRQQAEQKGIPVVELTETPPQGSSYVRWMDQQLDALDRALAKATP